MSTPDFSTALHGALQRVVGDMTLDTLIAYERDRQRRAELAMTNMIQHLRLPIRGKVKGYPTWGELDATFGYPFIYAPGRSFDNHHDTPHYSYGYEHTSGDPVMVHPHVSGWKFNDKGWCVGARLRYGVMSAMSPYYFPSPSALPGAGSVPPEARAHEFSGVVHLTFTGFANPVDDVIDDGS